MTKRGGFVYGFKDVDLNARSDEEKDKEEVVDDFCNALTGIVDDIRNITTENENLAEATATMQPSV